MRTIKSLLLASVILIASTFASLAQPSIQITDPQDGSFVQGGKLNPFWTEVQSPVGVMLVEHYINGVLVVDYPLEPDVFLVLTSYYWRTKGQHVFLLEARAVDWFGMETWADPVTVFKQ